MTIMTVISRATNLLDRVDNSEAANALDIK